MDEKLYTIKSLANESGLSQVYIRRAIHQGKLAAHKEPVSEGSKTLQNVIRAEDFEAWRASTGSRSRRDDGRNRFLLYATKDERAQLEAMIAEADMGVIIMKQVHNKKEPAAE